MQATIDDKASVHTLINTFTVEPERQQSVIASLRRFTEQHARSLPGFVAASIHSSADGHRVLNYVQWKTQADLRAMLSSDAARAHMAEVGALATHVDPIVYTVAYVGSRDPGPA